MTDQLLFHEKCNSDVREILDSFSKQVRDTTQIKREFLLRLTETYQLIFERPAVSSGTVFEMNTSWNERIEKKILRVSAFPYIVVYMYLSNKTTVILGVISTVSY